MRAGGSSVEESSASVFSPLGDEGTGARVIGSSTEPCRLTAVRRPERARAARKPSENLRYTSTVRAARRTDVRVGTNGTWLPRATRTGCVAGSHELTSGSRRTVAACHMAPAAANRQWGKTPLSLIAHAPRPKGQRYVIMRRRRGLFGVMYISGKTPAHTTVENTRCRHAGLSPRPQRALPRPQPLPGHARTSTRNVSQGIQDSPRSDADRIAHPWRILTMIRSPQPNRGAAATRQQRRSSPAIFLPDLAGEPSPSSWTRRRCVPSVRWSLCAGHAREDPLRP
eukprot:scaffold7153_cov115-Isochrysis_galbana.AAC.7